MATAFDVAWAVLKGMGDNLWEETQNPQTSLDVFSAQCEQCGKSVDKDELEGGACDGCNHGEEQPPQMGSAIASRVSDLDAHQSEMFDEEGNLVDFANHPLNVLQMKRGEAPTSLGQPLPSVAQAKEGNVKRVGVSRKKPKVTVAPGAKKKVGVSRKGIDYSQFGKVPWTNPRTGETIMVNRVQNPEASERSPKFVPVVREKRTEPKLSEFARAKIEEEAGIDDAARARKQKAIDNQMKDAKEARVVETSVKGKGTETVDNTQMERSGWLSTKPCIHCNTDFKDYSQNSTACHPCRNAMAKDRLPERLHRLKFVQSGKNKGQLSNHPINAKKE